MRIMIVMFSAALAACTQGAVKPDANYLVLMQHYEQASARAADASAKMAATCAGDLCRYLVAKSSVGSIPLPNYHPPENPFLGTMDRLLGLARVAAPIAGAAILARQTRKTIQSVNQTTTDVAGVIASIPTASDDHSVNTTVNGNLGNTDDSTTYGDGTIQGDGNVVGDANGDGDRVAGIQQNGNTGRIGSDGNDTGGDDNSGNTGRQGSAGNDVGADDNSGNSGRQGSPGDNIGGDDNTGADQSNHDNPVNPPPP